MAITEAEVKQQIILEVGDVDPQTGDPPIPASAGVIAQRIDYLWDRFSAWNPCLRELYCRQAAIRLALGVLAPRRFDSSDTRAGLSIRAHQIVDSYVQMLEATTAEIEVVKKSGGASAGVGAYRGRRLVHTTPVEATSLLDPNALRYGGTMVDQDTAVPGDDVTGGS